MGNPHALQEENKRLQHDLSQALEERNRLLKKLKPSDSGKPAAGSRVLEERLHTTRSELDRARRDLQVLQEKNFLLEDRLKATGRIPAIFLSRLEDAIISVEGRIPSNEVQIENAADAPDQVANRFNVALEALWEVLGANKVHHNNELKRELAKHQALLQGLRKDKETVERERDELAQRTERAEAESHEATVGIQAREEKLTGLRNRIADLEEENNRLAKASLRLKTQVKDLRGAVDPDVFGYISEVSARGVAAAGASVMPTRGKGWLPGLALGMAAGVLAAWLFGLLMPVSSKPVAVPPRAPAPPEVAATSAAAAPDKPDTPAQKVLPMAGDALADGGRGPALVRLPGGRFAMGTDRYGAAHGEHPARPMQVAAFAIGRYEVSFDEYDAFARATARALPDDGGLGRGRRPVVNVSWNDAQAYTRWLGSRTGRRYRLPTEAEWEYAIAGGADTIFWWGNDFREGMEVCFDCGGGWNGAGAAPVGQGRPNPYGLYDMGGNVMEWASDCDGADCSVRVVRGGAFNKPAETARITARRGLEARTPYAMVGFRVVREVDGER